MDDAVRAYLEKNHAAAMITLRADGTPHAARIGVALVGDKLWSSGNQGGSAHASYVETHGARSSSSRTAATST
ncbi:MAG: hypothetical protein DWI48_05685 [Chloroflexi bacterium]|nr:MAG: hypothetical protein DWI48_05685 [Chloroflexota bacterium]